MWRCKLATSPLVSRCLDCFACQPELFPAGDEGSVAGLADFRLICMGQPIVDDKKPIKGAQRAGASKFAATFLLTPKYLTRQPLRSRDSTTRRLCTLLSRQRVCCLLLQLSNTSHNRLQPSWDRMLLRQVVQGVGVALRGVVVVVQVDAQELCRRRKGVAVVRCNDPVARRCSQPVLARPDGGSVTAFPTGA